MSVYSLSIHADYGCRHSGACCTAGWDIPVELTLYRTLADAHKAGRLTARDPFVVDSTLPQGVSAMVRHESSGPCVFFERDARLCEIHRVLGEGALPAACRHFPRVALRDGRGTFVTLSHFCPTAAASLLRGDVPLEIVKAPPAFPDIDYDGLDAVDALPPLLHPRMLMDLEGYAAWETHMVRRFAVDATPESALDALARDVEDLRRWRPGGAALAEVIAALPPRAPDRRLSADPALGRFSAPVCRYLAARAFANWCAYQGHGLRTILRSLEASLDVLKGEIARACAAAERPLDQQLFIEAVRATDLLLVYRSSREQLAQAWSQAEENG
jgi:Fe-S-cluster containining protein